MFRQRGIFYVSPITLRILAVNIAALLILALGLLYTGQYEREMINSERKSLLAEGRLLAAALASGGVRETLDGDPVLTEDLSLHMLRQLAEANRLHTVLFSKTGKLLLDSRHLQGPGGAIQVVELDPPFSSWHLDRKLSYFVHKLLEILPTRLELPPYPRQLAGIETYPGVVDALNGEGATSAWHDENGHIVLTASLPVQTLKNVLGAVLLSREGNDIERAVRDVHMTVLKLFLWALLTTILLSIYLSETIGIPILRLAAAADRAQQSLALKESIPDFSHRGDEIGVLSTALRTMTAGLAERIDAISNFAADVAHEIKNPLASLKSAVETFARVEDAARQKRLLTIISEDVSRLNRLITDIAMASRLDSEISRAEKTLFDLAELLREVAKVEGEALGLGPRLALDVEPQRKLWVTGNAAQLGQVMHNLIHNAFSFLPPEGKITLSGLFQEGKVVVQVDNDGPEIPEQKLEAIFERFYSERPEAEKFGLHSGLGLSISRQIVRGHHGVIFAKNLKDDKNQQRGVRFTIVLPAGAAT